LGKGSKKTFLFVYFSFIIGMASLASLVGHSILGHRAVSPTATNSKFFCDHWRAMAVLIICRRRIIQLCLRTSAICSNQSHALT
jgi:hypothetical protein